MVPSGVGVAGIGVAGVGDVNGDEDAAGFGCILQASTARKRTINGKVFIAAEI
jgi:hypothetical protein